MLKIKLLLISLLLINFSFAIAKESYVVFNTSKGVILFLKESGDTLQNPTLGTKLSIEDSFILNDDRYFVKIKDTKTGEIFTYSGKGVITPREIVDNQRYHWYDKFHIFLKFLAEDTGFETEPKCTSQCASHYKGPDDLIVKDDSLSNIMASQIKLAISDSIYDARVNVRRIPVEDDKSIYFSIQNRDSINYGMVLYTVAKNGCISKHDDIIRYDSILEDLVTDKIEFLRLIPQKTIDLDYFNMAEEDYTCYTVFFQPQDIYEFEKNKYKCFIAWDSITNYLNYQGNVNRAIYIHK